MQTKINSISVANASKRIKNYIHRTPVMKSGLLNNFLGHEIYFKVESLQKVGAFKARGAINTLLSLKETKKLPNEVVAFSSGNHAQGVAWAATILGIKSTIFMPEFASKLKQQATKAYGGNVILTKTRKEAEENVQEFINKGITFIHPYDNENVIAGQGTACYEALEDIQEKIDVVFAPCGGGGLLSGTYLATKEISPKTKVIGCEPVKANDAARSLKNGKIFSFKSAPDTIADGVMTLSISELTFSFLKQLDDFIEVEEKNIIYWTQWLTHLLKVNVEPSSALAMAGANQWLKTKSSKKKILIILSGGNISFEKHKEIWKENYLNKTPDIF